ncbi:MAG: 3-hydroxyacyl-[acyl-carrier-protein] dehydratase FabZ [Butyricicoccus sp.]
MLNKEQIMEILPHRPPMLLVDEILEMDENHVVGALHLTGDEFFFQGHFPGNPIMPAVFRLEALAQAGGVALLSLPEFKGKTAVYTGITRQVGAMAAGDTFVWKSPSPRRGPMAVAEGIAWSVTRRPPKRRLNAWSSMTEAGES